MSTRSDLTGFAALLGESFAARIDLLTQVLQSAHYPSLGTYKERLLSETIKNYLPKSMEVGTGFVMFPHEDVDPPGGLDVHDYLNRSAFTISRQCDILVFDANTYPPVFRDGDFVVVRPESVRAVIEVKSTLRLTEVNKIVQSFVDFGRKWKTTQKFYSSHHQKNSPMPLLASVIWGTGNSSSKQKSANITLVRKTISSEYAKYVGKEELDNFPLLDSLMIYNEAEIRNTFTFAADKTLKLGWFSTDGRFRRFNKQNEIYRDKDRTIASLLANLHLYTARESFNRFFSYMDETRDETILPYRHHGYSWCWEGLLRVPANG
jgi:hypothetical protein